MNIRQFFSIAAMVALVFAGLTSCNQTPAASDAGATAGTSTKGNIVFIRLDSITVQYAALKAKLDVLEEKAAVAEKAQNDRVAAFQNDLANLQRRAQSGQMAPKQIGQEQERLAGREQTLMQDAQRVRQELELEQYQLMGEYEENLKNVLEEVQTEFGYDYILSYGTGTGVLMVNDVNDITPEVAKRINLIPMDGELDSEAGVASEEEATEAESE